MARTKSKSSVICDAGPIIHLDELDYLSILEDFSEILVPQAVFDEVTNNRSIDLNKYSFQIVTPPIVSSHLETIAQVFCLHPGEISALSLAHERKDFIFLTDDASAHLAAMQMNIEVHGTIGILLRSVRRELKPVNEIIDCLESLHRLSTLHIKNDLIRHAIDELKKSKWHNA
ncbi:MAG: DNA-binding protein [Proteobacteria bacterium]|nr:DNA-binding protein [Pseudomonadota bacterium]